MSALDHRKIPNATEHMGAHLVVCQGRHETHEIWIITANGTQGIMVIDGIYLDLRKNIGCILITFRRS